jgi:hypothetical protein
MACGATEVRDQKDLDQFQGERRPNHLSSQAGDIHVVIFNALMGGKFIVNEPGSDTGNFICRDRRANAAAAERHSALNILGSDGSGQGDDQVRIVISGVQLVCAEVYDLVS